MRITPAENRAYIYGNLTVQLFSVAVIAYAFLCPIPTSIRILFGLVISLMMTIMEHLTATMTLERKRIAENEWFEALTFRNALDDVLRRREHATSVDWTAAADEAKQDILSFDASARMQDEISGGKVAEPIIMLFAAPFILLIRILVGAGIAQLLVRFAPNVAAFLTGAA